MKGVITFFALICEKEKNPEFSEPKSFCCPAFFWPAPSKNSKNSKNFRKCWKSDVDFSTPHENIPYLHDNATLFAINKYHQISLLHHKILKLLHFSSPPPPTHLCCSFRGRGVLIRSLGQPVASTKTSPPSIPLSAALQATRGSLWVTHLEVWPLQGLTGQPCCSRARLDHSKGCSRRKRKFKTRFSATMGHVTCMHRRSFSKGYRMKIERASKQKIYRL